MPTITVNMRDMFHLAGKEMELDELEQRLRLAKAELELFDAQSGEARIELNDTGRPDLWCAEGIARQLKSAITGERPVYPFFEKRLNPSMKIDVDAGLEKVRPFVAAFTAKGPPVSDAFLVQMIQTQEKLCENYGRKRRNIAIGIYNADRIEFPVRYTAAGQDEYPFVPLGFEEVMPLKKIIEEHPKGREYGHLVDGFGAYPLLADRAGKVLSFPPIVNSRETGEVMVGDSFLFVEATGIDMRQIVLSMNIMAANFADRGWTVDPVLTRLPYASEFGREVSVPVSLDTVIEVEHRFFAESLGSDHGPQDVVKALAAYGVEAEAGGKTITAKCPPFRDDYLHAVDVVEDFAISVGYDSFSPVMPSSFTVGMLKSITVFADRVREQMVGLGFEEIVSNILSRTADEREKMCIADEPIVEIDNVMSESYSVLRSSILPSLLRVEAQSSKALYPHKLFEVGEVCRMNPERKAGTETELLTAALWASADSGFSEMHSVLEQLFYYLVIEYELQPVNYPFYFEGRAADIVSKGDRIGHVGEVHPEVLTRFGISMPCAAFEFALDSI